MYRAFTTIAITTSMANATNNACQLATESMSPPAMGPNAGPTNVTALTTPMYVPSLPCGATSSVRFMPMGTIMPVPSAWMQRATMSMGKLTDAAPTSVPASSSTSAMRLSLRVVTLRYRKLVTGTVTAATSIYAVETHCTSPEVTP